MDFVGVFANFQDISNQTCLGFAFLESEIVWEILCFFPLLKSEQL